jgi:hypothetical protein
MPVRVMMQQPPGDDEEDHDQKPPLPPLRGFAFESLVLRESHGHRQAINVATPPVLPNQRGREPCLR